jgi:hypothetical protein
MKSAFGEGYFTLEPKVANDKVLSVVVKGNKAGSITLNQYDYSFNQQFSLNPS